LEKIGIVRGDESMCVRVWVFVISNLVFWENVMGYQIVDSFPSPRNEPRGLAWDGTYLWCADAGMDSVYCLNTLGGIVISAFPFSIDSSYGGLTWGKDSSIWIANGRIIYEVNPTNGDEIYNFICPGG
jgi:hypothetical protein